MLQARHRTPFGIEKRAFRSIPAWRVGTNTVLEPKSNSRPQYRDMCTDDQWPVTSHTHPYDIIFTGLSMIFDSTCKQADGGLFQPTLAILLLIDVGLMLFRFTAYVYNVR